jgi:hypothetical protein
MLIVAINGTDYNVPSGWADVSLSAYIAYSKLPKLPQYESIADMPDHVYYGELIPHFCKSIAALTDIPQDVLMQCDIDQLERLYTTLMGQLKTPEYRYKPSVKITGETWFFPERFMLKSTVGEYVEAAQLEKVAFENEQNIMEVMPKIAAYLLKKDGEQGKGLDDAIIAQRTPLFALMPMSVAWDLYFFLRRRNDILQLALQIVSPSLKVLKLRQELIQS